MATLPAQDRTRVGAAWMRDLSEARESVAWTKPDLAAAVAAVDDWVEANTAAFNAALPQPFRSTATPTQKTALLAYVLWRRAGRLRVPEDS